MGNQRAGQCVKGNNCSFRHDMDKRGKSSPSNPSQIFFTEPEVPGKSVVECRDGFARITLEEFAITHSVKDGILQNACSTRPRVVVGLEKSAHSHRQVEQPTKRFNDKSVVVMLIK